jgi:hypothetical protein
MQRQNQEKKRRYYSQDAIQRRFISKLNGLLALLPCVYPMPPVESRRARLRMSLPSIFIGVLSLSNRQVDRQHAPYGSAAMNHPVE